MNRSCPALTATLGIFLLGVAGCLSPAPSAEPLRPGDRVRPVPAPGPSAEYEIRSVEGSMLLLQPAFGDGASEIGVRLGDLVSVEVERDTSIGDWVWRSALQGALLGGVLAASGSDPQYGAEGRFALGLAGGLLGGLVGGVAGVIRGERLAGPRWVPVELERNDRGPDP